MNILIAENISSEVLNGFATGSVSVQSITLFAIVIGAIFVNNVVLSQFLGICPFLGVSKKLNQAVGMGVAVTFIMTLTCLITYPIYTSILVPLGLEYLEIIVFIFVIASLISGGTAREGVPHTLCALCIGVEKRLGI